MIPDTRDTESAGAVAWRARRLSLSTVEELFESYWASMLTPLPFHRRLLLSMLKRHARRSWAAALSMRYDLNEQLLTACRRYAYENYNLKSQISALRSELEPLKAGRALRRSGKTRARMKQEAKK